MLNEVNLANYRTVQNIAKTVLYRLSGFIRPGVTEAEIAEEARELLLKHGVDDAWYYGIHALVQVGSRSCQSVSGRSYKPSTEVVEDSTLVTVDLSPAVNARWGDCARSFAVEGGVATSRPRTEVFREGMDLVQALHESLVRFATPRTTFHELHAFANQLVCSAGYRNMDFAGNFGHSIEEALDLRTFVERNNHRTLGGVLMFTFEPHIAKADRHWGFKHENIYFFDETDRLIEL